jgi:ADP-ribose pyrophosphatase YjhB (NUDIX family)
MALARHSELNFCPHCGDPLEDRRAFGRWRRACPSCDRVIFREHKVAAGVLVEDEGSVLLVRRRFEPQKGVWTLPAGFVDYGEDPAEAGVRECREETGLEVEITGLLDVISGREHLRGADIVIVYLARRIAGSPRPSDDADQAAFFAPDALPPLAFRATEQAVALWRRRPAGSST